MSVRRSLSKATKSKASSRKTLEIMPGASSLSRRGHRNPKPLPVSSHPEADPELASALHPVSEPARAKPEPIVSINGTDVEPALTRRAA